LFPFIKIFVIVVESRPTLSSFLLLQVFLEAKLVRKLSATMAHLFSFFLHCLLFFISSPAPLVIALLLVFVLFFIEKSTYEG